jgi:hypothetical protein
MGNIDEILTPKGLFESGSVEAHLSYYIGNYKGGRNESFMYGVDKTTTWYDYDLTSAYTTAMSDVNLPDYLLGRIIPLVEFNTWTDKQILNNFIILNDLFFNYLV